MMAMTAGTDPLNADTDGDGLLDGLEIGLVAPQGDDTNLGIFVADLDPGTTTDPTLFDTDGDGLDDVFEDANGNGQADAGETRPDDADTDGDGYSDGEEIAQGTDPLDPQSTPASPIPTLPNGGAIALALGLLVAARSALTKRRSGRTQ